MRVKVVGLIKTKKITSPLCNYRFEHLIVLDIQYGLMVIIGRHVVILQRSLDFGWKAFPESTKETKEG